MNFINELPTVFKILKFNPEAIVDDTAIERLLNSLEEISTQKNKDFELKCIVFVSADEIWNHPVTLSFALRIAGFVGTNSLSQELLMLIKTLLHDTTKCKRFKEASVQYGLFKCLTSLSSADFWFVELEGYLDLTLEAFKNSYLYVKKASIVFFASYLRTAGRRKIYSFSALQKCLKVCPDIEQLKNIIDSIFLLCQQDTDIAMEILYNNNDIISTSMQTVKDQFNDSYYLADSLISLFSVLMRHDVSWNRALNISDEVHLFFLGFLELIRSNGTLKILFPSLCDSLIHDPLNVRYFSSSWNSYILELMLRNIIYNDECFQNITDRSVNMEDKLNVKSWKKLFVATANVLCKISKKQCIESNMLSQQLLDAWLLFCLRVLTVSLNCNLNELIDEYLISVINDKKITRTCFLYLNAVDFQNLNDKVTTKFVASLSTCLTCHTDNAQIICSSLDLLSKFIKAGNMQLLDHTKLADILNMKLWDVNWEVKDSLLNVLTAIVENASTQDAHVEFLQSYTFWCKVLDLIDDNESYVRSNTVALIGRVYLESPVWQIFSHQNNDYSMIHLLQRFKDIFIDFSRQDDMFTRRSILKMITLWICSGKLNKIFGIPSDADLTQMSGNDENDTDVIRNLLIEIFLNGSRDFDWEVRKLAICLWTNVINLFSNDYFTEWQAFIDLLIDNNIASVIIDNVCDCEYEVTSVALKCLLAIRNKYPIIIKDSEVQRFTSEHSVNLPISSSDELEAFIKTNKIINEKKFRALLHDIDFETFSHQLEVLDVNVKSDPLSFLQDIVASAKQSNENLLDCY